MADQDSPSGITRASINASCVAGMAATCASAAALLSFGTADEIRDMPTVHNVPTNVSIRNVAETNQISANWAGLLDGNIDGTLLALGASNGNYWTGSTAAGARLSNCSNWTNTASVNDGTVGTANESNSRWLDNSTGGGNSPHNCGGTRGVNCLCW